MNDFLKKMYDLYINENDDNKKFEIASLLHSICQKKYPMEYYNLKVKLHIVDNITFDNQSNYFLDHIDKYSYENQNFLIIEKDQKTLKRQIVDINEYFSQIAKNEVELFFVKSFFLNPSYFDQFQIKQFIKTLN